MSSEKNILVVWEGILRDSYVVVNEGWLLGDDEPVKNMSAPVSGLLPAGSDRGQRGEYRPSGHQSYVG